jgi:ABC-type ATPase involved in cell division
MFLLKILKLVHKLILWLLYILLLEMIYITGASGSGKITILKNISMKGYDIDVIF